MDKTAQKRSLLNKLHETANIPGRSMEKFFKPQFEEIMKSLVVKDDTIRSILLGQKVGKQVMPKPDFEPISAKELLSKAKSYINQREYISAVSVLSRFHKKMQDIVTVIDSLDFDVSKIHHQFLFGKKMPEKKYMDHLSDFEKRIASQEKDFLIKQAGIIDSLKNLFTQRGRSLRSWESKYEDRVKPIREGTIAQLEASQNLLSTILGHLKTMASLRAARKVDAYVDESKAIKAAFQAYDTGKDSFRNFYSTVIKPHVDTQRQQQQEAQSTSYSADAVNNMLTDQSKKNLDNATLFGNAPTSNSPPPGNDAEEFGHVSIPSPPPLPTNVEPSPGNGAEPAQPAPAAIPSLPIPGIRPPAFKSDEVAEELFGPKKSSYDAFVDSLQVFSNENPSLLAAHISKYAKSIQSEQPEMAVKLFKIAKSLRG